MGYGPYRHGKFGMSQKKNAHWFSLQLSASDQSKCNWLKNAMFIQPP